MKKVPFLNMYLRLPVHLLPQHYAFLFTISPTASIMLCSQSALDPSPVYSITFILPSITPEAPK